MHDSNIFHSCLVSAFDISIQLMFTRSQSTSFRVVHSMYLITVSLGWSVSFSRKISLSQQNNHWLSQTRSSLLKFSAQYSQQGYILWNPSLWSTMTSTRSKINFVLPVCFFKVIFNPWSPILDPSFPVNLEVLLIKIVLLFDVTS